MKHESAVQAVKELMRKDSVFRTVIQGWGVATLLIGIFMFYKGPILIFNHTSRRIGYSAAHTLRIFPS